MLQDKDILTMED